MPNLFELINEIKKEDQEAKEYNEKLARIPKATRTRKGLTFKNVSNPFVGFSSPMVDMTGDRYRDLTEVVPEDYWQAAVEGNWDLFNLPEDMDIAAAETMEGNRFGKMHKGFWQQFGEGFKGMFKSWNVIGGFDDYSAQEESRQSLERILEGKGTTLYSDPRLPRMRQWNYLAQQVQSLGLSMGIMAEQAAEMILTQGALTGLSAAKAGLSTTRIGKFATNVGAKLSRTGKISEINNAKQAFQNVYKEAIEAGKTHAEAIRMAEKAHKLGKSALAVNSIKDLAINGIYGATSAARNAYLNRTYTEDEAFTKYLREGMSEEEAREQAHIEGNRAWHSEFWPSMLINTIQMGIMRGMINSAGRNTLLGANRRQGSLLDVVTGKIKDKRIRTAVGIGTEIALEGAQEGFEEWASMRGQRIGYDERLQGTDYTRTNERWKENAERYIDNIIGGALGGLVFGVGGKALTSGFKKIAGKSGNEERRKAVVQKFEDELKSSLTNTINVANNIELKRKEIRAKLKTVDKDSKEAKSLNKQLEELGKKEREAETDLLQLFDMARIANGTLGEEDKIDYVADVATRISQQIGAANDILGFDAEKLQKVAEETKLLEDNEKKKGTNEYKNPEELNLTTEEKDRQAYNLIRSMSDNPFSDAIFDENGNLNRDALEDYKKTMQNRLEEWAFIVNDFSEYYFSMRMDEDMAVQYAKILHDNRMADRELNDNVLNLNAYLDTLVKTGDVKDKFSLLNSLRVLFGMKSIGIADNDKVNVVDRSVKNYLSKKKEYYDKRITEQETALNNAKNKSNDLLQKVESETDETKKKAAEKDLEKNNKKIEGIEKLIEDYKKKSADYDSESKAYTESSDLTPDILSDIIKLKNAEEYGEADVTVSQGAIELYEFMKTLKEAGERTIAIRNRNEAMANSILTTAGYRIASAVRACNAYHDMLARRNRKGSLKRAIRDMEMKIRSYESIPNEKRKVISTINKYYLDLQGGISYLQKKRLSKTKDAEIEYKRVLEQCKFVLEEYKQKLKTVESKESLTGVNSDTVKTTTEEQENQKEVNATRLATAITDKSSPQNETLGTLHNSFNTETGISGVPKGHIRVYVDDDRMPDGKRAVLVNTELKSVKTGIIGEEDVLTQEQVQQAIEIAEKKIEATKKVRTSFRNALFGDQDASKGKEVKNFKKEIYKIIVQGILDGGTFTKDNINSILESLNDNEYGIEFTAEQLWAIQDFMTGTMSWFHLADESFEEAVSTLYSITNGQLNNFFHIAMAYFEIRAEEEHPKQDFKTLWKGLSAKTVVVNGEVIDKEVVERKTDEEQLKDSGKSEEVIRQIQHDKTLAQHDKIQLFQGFEIHKTLNPFSSLIGVRFDFMEEDESRKFIRIEHNGVTYLYTTKDGRFVGSRLDEKQEANWNTEKWHKIEDESYVDSINRKIQNHALDKERKSKTGLSSKIKDADGKEPLGKEAFDIIHNPQRIKRIYAKHISDKKKELAYRLGLSYDGDNPLVHYLEEQGLLKHNDKEIDINATYDAIEKSSLEWTDVFSQSLTPIYAEDQNGKEIMIGVLNAKSYFKTRESDIDNTNTIPSWKKVNGEDVRDDNNANMMKAKIHRDLDDIAEKSLSGEVGLLNTTSVIRKSNDANLGNNRALTDEEKEGKLFFPDTNRNNGNRYAQNEDGESIKADVEGLRDGECYIEIYDEATATSTKESISARVHLPGSTKIMTDADGRESLITAERYEKENGDWDLSKESPEFYQEIVYQLGNYFAHYLFDIMLKAKAASHTDDEIRAILLDIFSNNDDVRTMFNISDAQKAVDGFMAWMDKITQDGSGYSFDNAVSDIIRDTKSARPGLPGMRVWNMTLDGAKTANSPLARYHLSPTSNTFFLSKNPNDEIALDDVDVTQADFGKDLAAKMNNIAHSVVQNSKKLALRINTVGQKKGRGLANMSIVDSMVENFGENMGEDGKRLFKSNNSFSLCGSSPQAENVLAHLKNKAMVNLNPIEISDGMGGTTTTIFKEANLNLEIDKGTGETNDTESEQKETGQKVEEKDDYKKFEEAHPELFDDLLSTHIGKSSNDVRSGIKPNEAEQLKRSIVQKAFAIIEKEGRNIYNMSLDDILAYIRNAMKKGMFDNELQQIEQIKNEIDNIVAAHPNDERNLGLLNKKKLLEEEASKLESIANDEIINDFLKNEKTRKGIITRFIIDMLGNKTSFDLSYSDNIEELDDIEEKATKTPNPNKLSKNESYEASEEEDISSYLKVKLSFIRKKVKRAHNMSQVSDYLSVQDVLAIIRGFSVITTNFDELRKRIQYAINMKADNYYELEQILDILDSLPQQYKNELAYKNIRSRVNMMYVLHKDRQSRLVAIDVSQQAGRVYSAIKDFVFTNRHLTRFDEHGDFVLNIKGISALRNKAKGDIHERMKVFKAIMGYDIGENTILNNNASELLDIVLDRFFEYFDIATSTDEWKKNKDKALAEITVPKQYKNGSIYHKDVIQYMNMGNRLMKLIEFDIALNNRPIEAQFVVGNKQVLLTTTKTLKNKLFEDINSNGEYGTALREIYGNKMFQFKFLGRMPLDTGLVSISAIRNNGRNSDRITNLPESDNEMAETLFSQAMNDSEVYDRPIITERFDGEKINTDCKVRYGYETGLTNSNKRKLSFVRLPKISRTIRDDFSGIIDYMTEMALGVQLERFFREKRAQKKGLGFDRGNLHYNFNMSELNLIKIEIQLSDGTKRTEYLSEYLGRLETIEELKEAEDFLKKNYNSIFGQARTIISDFIISEMEERVGKLSFLREMVEDRRPFNENDRITIEGKDVEELEKGSWMSSGIVSIKNEKDGSVSLSSEWMDREFFDKVIDPEDEEDNDGEVYDSNGEDFGYYAVPLNAERLVAAVFDRVSNGFISDMFIQDTCYSSLNSFEEDSYGKRYKNEIEQTYKDIHEKEAEGNLDEAKALEQHLYDLMYDITVESAKSAGRALNKRMAGIDTGGNMPNFSDTEFIYLLVQETEGNISASELRYYIHSRYPQKAKEDKELETLLGMLESTDKDEKEFAKESLTKKYPAIKDYLNISTSDGQEFITWQEYLECAFAKGALSEQELETLTKIQKKLEKEEDLTDKEIEFLSKHGMNAQKPVYNGTHVIYDGFNVAGVQNMYVKSSALVLLPQYTRNTELDNVRKHMEKIQKEKDKKVRLAFNSTVKVNNNKSAVTFSDLQGEWNDELEQKVENSIVVAKRKFLSIQQETDNHMNYNMGENTVLKGHVKFLSKVLEGKDGMIIFSRVIDHIMDNKEVSKDFIASAIKIKMLTEEADESKNETVEQTIGRIADELGFTERVGFDVTDPEFIDRIMLRTETIESLVTDMLRSDTSTSILEEVFEEDFQNMDPRFTLAQMLFEPTTTEVVEATQLHNLLMADGFSKIGRDIFSVPKQVLERYGFEYEDNTKNPNVKISGKKLSELRVKMYKERILEEEARLCRELGVKKISDIDLKNPIVLKKIANLIVESFYDLGISDNTIQQLGLHREASLLDGDSFEFNIPLLFNASSQKIESMLMALVRNRICKSRINGNAYYVTTSEGFLHKDKTKAKKMTNEEMKGRGVLWLDEETASRGLRGCYQDNNGFYHAECAVSSRFTYLGEDGKEHILDFYDTIKDGNEEYFAFFTDVRGNKIKVERNSEGAIDLNKTVSGHSEGLILNKDMIDSRALEMMSLRIPTSGHMSCVMLEIKAFLPPSMGEAMVVSPQTMQQLGEDFDIDKRFSYFRHCMVDPVTKRIRVIDNKFINQQKQAFEGEIDIKRKTLYRKLGTLKKKLNLILDKIKSSEKEISWLEKEINDEILDLIEEDENDNEDVIQMKILLLLGDRYYDIGDDAKYDKIQSSLDNINNALEKIQSNKDLQSELKEAIKEYERTAEEIQEDIEEQKSKIAAFNKTKPIQDAYFRRLEDKNKENEFIDVYLSVFGCDDMEVQREINKVLGFEMYKTTKSRVIGMNSVRTKGKNTKRFGTPFKKSYQQHLRKENSDSQMGVGIASNFVVLMGLLQQSDVTIADFEMTIGNLTSKGDLSSPMMLHEEANTNPVMAKSEEMAAIQNINLDTVKADIIGYVNQNKQTYNFFCMMPLLGFGPVWDKEIQDQVSLAGLIAIQDIIREYTAMKAENETDLRSKKSNSSILEDVLVKYGFSNEDIEKLRNGEIVEIEDGQNSMRFVMEGSILRVCDKNGKAVDDYSDLNTESLYNMYKNGANSDNYKINQLVALACFMRVDSLSRSLSKFQKLINPSSAGVGKSYSDIRQRIRYLNEMGNSEDVFKGITKMIGEFVEIDKYNKMVAENQLSEDEQSEYFVLEGCDFVIKPTTIAGHTLLHALSVSQTLIGKTFGYDLKYMNMIFDEVEDRIASLELYQEDADKLRRVIIRDFRQFVSKLACDKRLCKVEDDLFGGRSMYEVENLLFGANFKGLRKNDSAFINTKRLYKTGELVYSSRLSGDFALRINDLIYFLKLKNFPEVNNNLFFKMFEMNKDTVKIKINSDRFSTDEIAQAFMDMINDDNPILVQDEYGKTIPMSVKLGDNNFYMVTPSLVAKLLLMNSMVGDNANGALDYRNMIPFDVLDYYGITTSFRGIFNSIRNANYDEKDDMESIILIPTDVLPDDTVTVKELVNRFLDQAEIMRPNLMLRSLPYRIYNGEVAGNFEWFDRNGQATASSRWDMPNVRSMRIFVSTKDIGKINKIRDAFGLYRITSQDINEFNTSDASGNLLFPETFTIKSGGVNYVFRLNPEKVSKKEARDAKNGYFISYGYDLVSSTEIEFGQNIYDPYQKRRKKEDRNLTIVNPIRSLNQRITNPQQIMKTVEHYIGNHYAAEMFNAIFKMADEQTSVKGYPFVVETGIDNEVTKEGNKIVIRLKNESGLSKAYNEEITAEELTHGLLYDYIRENYVVSGDTYTRKPGTKEHDGLPLLFKKYKAFRTWWAKNRTQQLQIIEAQSGKVFLDQADHIAGNFEEFLAAFIQCDKDFVTIINNFEASEEANAGKVAGKGMKLIDMVVNLISRILNQLISRLKGYGASEETIKEYRESVEMITTAMVARYSTTTPPRKVNAANPINFDKSVTMDSSIEHKAGGFYRKHVYKKDGKEIENQIHASNVKQENNSQVAIGDSEPIEKGQFVDWVARKVIKAKIKGGELELNGIKKTYLDNLRKELEAVSKDEKAIDDTVKSVEGKIEDLNIKEIISNILKALDGFTDIITDEHPMMKEFDGFNLVGTPDLIIIHNGRAHILDMKTSTRGTAYNDTYVLQLKAYTELINNLGYNVGIVGDLVINPNNNNVTILDYSEAAANITIGQDEIYQTIGEQKAAGTAETLKKTFEKSKLPDLC